MNLAYKVGQFRLRFAHLEKSPKFGGGTKFTIRFADWVKCIVEYLTITWIIWLDKSIKSRFWESYLFEERAKISAILFLKNVRLVSTVCAGLLTICEMEYDCEWKCLKVFICQKGEFFELICVSRLNRFAFKIDGVHVILINEKEE